MSPRREIVRRLRPVLVGQALTLRWPRKIVGRDTYLRVSSAATSVFGSGNYSVSKVGVSAIRVERTG